MAAKKKTAKKMGSAKKRSSAKKKSAGKRKLSPTAKKKIAAASRARWRARKGAGSKSSHIPLKVLKKNHENLGALIKRRESQGGWS